MPLLETKGAASAQGFGLTLQQAAPIYIEDVFSTWLYTGNSSTQTITNGIDFAGKGGMLGIFTRTSNSTTPNMSIWDTNRGTNYLITQFTSAQNDYGAVTTGVTSFNSNGFSLGSDNGPRVNRNENYASWSFRQQPKFFTQGVYTGNSVSGRALPHNLGSAPGCVIIKPLINGQWTVYNRGLNTHQLILRLNTTGAATNEGNGFFTQAPTSTSIFLGNNAEVNDIGVQYVYYAFAHNAGGFGLSGTDSVVSCGGFTTDGSGNASVDLGYEPQWILWKNSTTAGTNWFIHDVMRSWSLTTTDGATASTLNPNLNNAEAENQNSFRITPTGFTVPGSFGGSQRIVYVAIRRGPMKVPTTGTSVFSPIASSAAQGTQQTTNFPVDLQIQKTRGETTASQVTDRLRRVSATSSSSGRNLVTSSNAAESTSFSTTQFWNNTGFQIANFSAGVSSIYWNWGRAPNVFDMVAYTGDGTAGREVPHNLRVAPELIIIKNRTSTTGWSVYCAPLGNTGQLVLNENSAFSTGFSPWNNTTPTASVFTLNSGGSINANSPATFIAYLFATCPGVSKVGSYTGTGSTQVIDCGFTGGARFVLVKSTSALGAWYVWDSARGIVAGNDPYLVLNTATAEITNTDWVDTAASGFELSNAGGNLANSNGVSYIFLAMA